jgi:hypothetical protein
MSFGHSDQRDGAAARPSLELADPCAAVVDVAPASDVVTTGLLPADPTAGCGGA